jgi:phosphocarrier protein
VTPGLAEHAPGYPHDRVGDAAATASGADRGPTHAAMNGQPLNRIVTINDPQGLHMRPATAFAKAARQFQCAVTLRLNDRCVNGKSQLDLMLLAAEPGTELVLEVTGEDAAAALPILADLIESVAGEDNDPGPPPKG